MTRFFFAVAFALVFAGSIAQAQEIVKITLDRPSYNAGEGAHVRYRLAAQPESPAFEFFLSAKLGSSPIAINKITDTEFYSKLESLTHGSKAISVNIFIQDRALAKAITDAVAWHDSEIQRITDALPGADPEDVPAMEAELAQHQARRADAITKLSSIRRLFGTATLTFQVN